MSNTYNLVVFDWEGTLADTLGQILQTVDYQAQALGLGQLDKQLARRYVDLGLTKAIQKLFPNNSLAEHEKLLHAVQTAMLSRTSEVVLIPGAKELLIQLQQANMLIAVASNKGQQSLQRAIQSAGLESFFTVTRSAGQTPPKPSPEMLEEIMDYCGVSSSQTIMIGDSPMDMEIAVHCKVDCLGVDFYHQQRDYLVAAGAQKVFDDYKQLAVFFNFTSGD